MNKDLKKNKFQQQKNNKLYGRSPKQCAADAAPKGDKEFMFAGKKYKTTMSKLNAEKILGKRTDELTAEDEQLKEALPLLGLLIPAAGAALRTVAQSITRNGKRCKKHFRMGIPKY